MHESDSGTPWQLWVDGTSLPNPGRIGLGAVLLSPAGERREISRIAPGTGCNNEAELQALCAGLTLAIEAGSRSLIVVSDSDFVVRHVRGEQVTAITRLLGWIDAARMSLACFHSAELRWVPRHRNTEADRLARSALSLGPKGVKVKSRSRRSRRTDEHPQARTADIITI
ncbi:MAG: ribonuclease HI family protein [Proteobacteria bacterium]|nr:ribonuclease HI family protein [Pseudomonadota bacterium]HQR02697.1 ribonuclease HI family protein [Rhodocyclaceae bacterium]